MNGLITARVSGLHKKQYSTERFMKELTLDKIDLSFMTYSYVVKTTLNLFDLNCCATSLRIVGDPCDKIIRYLKIMQFNLENQNTFTKTREEEITNSTEMGGREGACIKDVRTLGEGGG